MTSITHDLPRGKRASGPPDWLITGLTRTVDEYLRHVAWYRARGLHPRRPVTVDEIEAMILHYPSDPLTPRLSPQQLRDMGLSPFLRTGAPPFSDDWKEQFFATLQEDPAFAASIGELIGGAR